MHANPGGHPILAKRAPCSANPYSHACSFLSLVVRLNSFLLSYPIVLVHVQVSLSDVFGVVAECHYRETGEGWWRMDFGTCVGVFVAHIILLSSTFLFLFFYLDGPPEESSAGNSTTHGGGDTQIASELCDQLICIRPSKPNLTLFMGTAYMIRSGWHFLVRPVINRFSKLMDVV